MGKALIAFVRFLLVLFVIGLIGYNTYEIARLRAEVNMLRAERRSGRSGELSIARVPASGAFEQIAEARSHAERAQALFKAQRLHEAAAEMRAASDSAARANADAQANGRGAVAHVQTTFQQWGQTSASLWKRAESMTNAANGQPPFDKHADKVRKTDDKHEQKSQ